MGIDRDSHRLPSDQRWFLLRTGQGFEEWACQFWSSSQSLSIDRAKPDLWEWNVEGDLVGFE